MRLFGVSLGEGNTKVGEVMTFSLPSHATCPGASPWRLRRCYPERGHLLLLHEAHRQALPVMPNEALPVSELERHLCASLPCRQIAVVLAACRGGLDAARAASGVAEPMGEIATRDVGVLVRESRRDCHVVCSCSPDEEAVELPRQSAGAFTLEFTRSITHKSPLGPHTGDVWKNVKRLLAPLFGLCQGDGHGVGADIAAGPNPAPRSATLPWKLYRMSIRRFRPQRRMDCSALPAGLRFSIFA